MPNTFLPKDRKQKPGSRTDRMPNRHNGEQTQCRTCIKSSGQNDEYCYDYERDI